MTAVVRRLAAAVPATGAAALAALLPADVRPSVPLWVAGTAALTALVCVVSRRRVAVVALAALATALGMLVQLRLGVPAGRLALLGTGAAVLFAGGLAAARCRRAGGRLGEPAVLRGAALVALGAAVVLRGLTALGPSPASGTLPVLGVQVGELTRALLVGGAALLVADPLLRRGVPLADRRFAVVAAGLAGVGLATLVALGDLGPAVLVVVAVLAVVVHTRGLRARVVLAVLAGTVVLAPVAWATSVVRTRVGEVVDPGPQVRGALTAAWSGGLVGPGPGRSPLVEGVPAIGSDYAVAALVADLGALVVVPVLLAVLAAEIHLVRSAATRQGPRAGLAVGLATLLAAQGCWSALGAVAVLPLTGLNQPFLGVSGASLLSSALLLGVLLGLLEGSPASSAPGTAPVSLAAGAGLRVTAVLVVAATVVLALGPRSLGDAEQLRMPRGTIWTADGQVVATDVGGQRGYPAGGRYADLGFERRNDTHRGVEAVEADVLTCGGALGPADLAATLVHPVCRPADLVTTVDSRAQAALADGLGGAEGEATVLDARTGAVVGMWSSASTAPGATSVVRGRQGPPGSTMKLITGASALLRGVDFTGAPSRTFAGDDGSGLGNDGGATCPGTDAATALAFSCNSVYGWAATQVGADELARVARTYFGADQRFGLGGLDAAGLDTGLQGAGSTGALARTGIGQESARSSVLGVALATAVIANGMSPTPWPHVVAAVCGGGEPEVRPPGSPIGPPLPVAVARTVRDGMRAAVTGGTARRLVVPQGRDVVAKTGTAELEGGGIDSSITAVVDGRWVLTLVVHRAAEGAAIDTASRVLAALPSAAEIPLTCPSIETEHAS